jgi:hypothetical protein
MAAMSADAAISDYLALLAAYRAVPATPAFDHALSFAQFPALYDALRDDPPLVYARLADGLAQVTNGFAGGMLAIQLGSYVEQGAPPALLGNALTSWLPRAFADARRFIDNSDNGADPAAAAAWAGLAMFVPAAMAAWVRDAASRRAAARNAQLIADAKAVAARSQHGYFIHELLSAADGVELTVLAPEQRRGFVVELEVVRNIAHLQALLEDALVGDPAAGWLDGPRIDPVIAAIARSEQMIEQERPFAIGWNLQHRGGLRARPGGANLPTISATMAFEWSVQHLFTPDGRGVALLRPPGPVKRSCGAGFFAPIHDQLRSRTVVRAQLDAAAYDHVIASL